MDTAFVKRHHLHPQQEPGGLVRAACSCGVTAERAHASWSPRHNQGWHRTHLALAFAAGPEASPSLRAMTCRQCRTPVLRPVPDGEELCPHGKAMIAAMNAVGVAAFGWRPDRNRRPVAEGPQLMSPATIRWARSALAVDINALYDPDSDLDTEELQGVFAGLSEVAADLDVDLTRVIAEETTPAEQERMQALLGT